MHKGRLITMSHNILITGGTGYVGSHLTSAFLALGHKVVLIDNHYNSTPLAPLVAIDKIRNGRTIPTIAAYKYNCRDVSKISEVIKLHKINKVVHLAGYKSIYESFLHPESYLTNNVECTAAVVEAMRINKISDIMFSSSCTVYGDGQRGERFYEYDNLCPQSPYAESKVKSENILLKAEGLRPIIFRYFNPVGYHDSGFLYEYPKDNEIHNNLFYEISQVLLGFKKKLTVFGDIFDTTDGTARRNYLDINDLVMAHINGLDLNIPNNDQRIYNLANRSYTVQQIIDAFWYAGMYFEYEIKSAINGTFGCTDANIEHALCSLGWGPLRSIVYSIKSVKKVIENENKSGRCIQQ